MNFIRTFILPTVSLIFVFPFICESYPITHEEIEFINKKLAKEKRVIIDKDGIWCNKKNFFKEFPKEAETITFNKDAHIFWKGKGVLEIKAEGNIVFEEGSQIKNARTGGLKLWSGQGTIEFKGCSPQIDFTESDGAVSIFYNPPGETTTKYKNIINFSEHVKINPEKTFYKAFMLVHNLSDLINMDKNLQGDYALATSIHDIPFRNFKKITGPLKGAFNYEGRNLISKCYKDSHYDRLRRAYVENWDRHPCIASFVFEQCLDENWGENVMYTSPPLGEFQESLLRSLENGEDEKALEAIKNIFVSDPFLPGAMYFAFYGGSDKDTPLHLAAKHGRIRPLQQMLEYIFHSYKEGENDSYYLLRNPFSLLNRKNIKGRTPLDLAVRKGHLDSINLIISSYEKFNQVKLFDKNSLLSLAKRQEGIETIFLTSFDDLSYSFDKYLEGFPLKTTAQRKEYERQRKVIWRFFNSHLLGTRRTYDIFNDFVTRYNKGNPSFPVYNLEGIPSRSRIILLQAITNYKLKTRTPQLQKHYWDTCTRLSDNKMPYEVQVDRFPIIYQFGELKHTLRNESTTYKPGWVYYEEIGKYEEIFLQMSKIEDFLGVGTLAKLSKKSRSTGRSITPHKFEKKGYKEFTAKEDADYLNRVNFLLDLEVVFRLVEGSQSPWDTLPIASSNGRVFALGKNGKLSLKELLSKQSPHHPFTGDYSKRKRAIEGINEKFHGYFLEEHAPSENKELRNNINQWKKVHPRGYVIKTSEGLHQELLEEYGGDYESSGEEYTDN